MTRAAIYCRISQDDGRGLGVARQEQDCREFCDRRGWDVAAVLIDNDVSAYSTRPRPAYGQLLGGIEDGSYDALVVWHPDRLHRRPVELERFIDVVESSGVTVATVTAGDLDLSTPDGRLLARIVGSVARKESEDKSRRLRRKHLEIAQQGGLGGGGRRPFGFEADRVTIRPAEAAEIRDAVDRLLAGGSLRGITLDWNDRGVPTVTGARWSVTTVRRLLGSARIAGQRTHRGVIVGPATWPAIIDADTAVRVRAVLASRDSRQVSSGPRSYLVTGILWCGRCDIALSTQPVIRKGHRYRRYTCPRDRGGCGRLGVSADRVEEYLVDRVMEAVSSRRLERGLSVVDDSAQVAEVAQVEARMGELAEMYAAGEIGRAEWAAARTALEGRLRRAQEGIAAVSRRAPLVGPAEDWGELAFDRRRAIVTAALERVTVAPTGRSGNRFDPGRLTIEWAA